MAVAPQVLPALAAAALMLGLAAWLLWLGASNAPNRAFALFLVFRAATVGAGPLLGASTDPATADYLARVLPYLFLPLVPILVWFLSVYPRPRGPLGRPGGGWVVLGAVVALEAAYLLDHGLLWTLRGGAEAGLLAAGPGLAYASFGPLVLLNGLLFPLLALASLLFALDHARTPQGASRRGLLLVCAGFLLNALFDGTLRLAALAGGAPGFPWLPWGWAFALLPAATLVPAAAALVVLARSGARRLVAAAALPVGSALALAYAAPEAAALGHPAAVFVLGVWRLALPALVTLALVRHQLFDVDLRVRWTLKQSTLVAVGALVFVLLAEALESVIADRLGSGVALVAALALTYGARPVRRFADDMARRALPKAKPVEEMAGDEIAWLYREQVELALQDGELKPKEREMLDRLRARLGLSPEAARAIEADVSPA